MKALDDIPFSEEEKLQFKEEVKKMQNGRLLPYKKYDRCIATALCRIGTSRREAICGTYVSGNKDIMTKMISLDFTKEEQNAIIEYCMNDSYCDENLLNRLESCVPILMGRSKTLMDYVEETKS